MKKTNSVNNLLINYNLSIIKLLEIIIEVINSDNNNKIEIATRYLKQLISKLKI